MSSLVRFAAMIPATCAVVSASPFGSSRRRRAVSVAMRTVAVATARRRDSGLPPTSTMRTSPVSLTWLSSLTCPTLATCRRCDTVERLELQVDPGAQVVLADVRADRLDPGPALILAHLQRVMDRLGLTLEIERV